MDQKKFNLDVTTSKSNHKITLIKPIIKLETNPEILKNLKEVFSSQKIKEQIKSAVNKLQADDALPSSKRSNAFRPGNVKFKPKLQSNSVKETLRTSILHKNATTTTYNQSKNVIKGSLISAEFNNSEMRTKSQVSSRSYDISKNSEFQQNVCSNYSVNKNNNMQSSKILNKKHSIHSQNYCNNSSGTRKDFDSNEKHNNLLNSKLEQIQNSELPVQINVLNNETSNKTVYEFSYVEDKFILDNSSDKTNIYPLKCSHSQVNKIKANKVLSESGTESENETGQSDVSAIYRTPQKSGAIKNLNDTLKKKHYPIIKTGNISNTFIQSRKNSSCENLTSNIVNFNVEKYNLNQSGSDEQKFDLLNPKLKNRKKENIVRIQGNPIKDQNQSDNFVENKNSDLNVEKDPLSAFINYKVQKAKLNSPKGESYTVPDIKIQKASINIQGKQTENYKVDILNKRYSNEDNSQKEEHFYKIPIEEKTTITHNFIKRQLEKNSIFKSPENPPKNRLDDINFQDVFLINEIEDRKNPSDMFIKSEENFDANLQDITCTNDIETVISLPFNNESSEHSNSDYSPNLIQDLDSNKIFNQKSLQYSPKTVQSINSNVILKQNFDICLDLANTKNITDSPMKSVSNNPIFSSNQEVDAVDFLCNLNNEFIKHEDDDVSETSSNIDDTEILRPEDFLQNISKSCDEKNNHSELLVNNSKHVNYELSANNPDKNISASRLAPIVIENKILADYEKINLNLCLGNVLQIDEIVNTRSTVTTKPINEKSSIQVAPIIENFNITNSQPMSENNITEKVNRLNVCSSELDKIKKLESPTHNENFSPFNEVHLNERNITKNQNNMLPSSSTSLKEIMHDDIFKTNDDLKISHDAKLLDNKINPIESNENFINFEKNTTDILLPADELPFSEEEIINTSEADIMLTNSLTLNDKINSMSDKKPKTVPISSRRPRLRGSKINLVQRRKGSTIINNNSKSRTPENEENPSISPHLPIENKNINNITYFEITQQDDEIIKKNIEVQNSLEIEENLKLERNLIDNKIGKNIVNDIDCSKNNFEFSNGDCMDVFNTEVISPLEVNNCDNHNTVFNPTMIESFVMNKTQSQTNDDEMMQSDNRGDISNGSDISNPDFIGFDLSLVKVEQYSIYNNTINEITNKLNITEAETNFTISSERPLESIVKIENEKSDVTTEYIISELPSLKKSENKSALNNSLSKQINDGVVSNNTDNIQQTTAGNSIMRDSSKTSSTSELHNETSNVVSRLEPCESQILFPSRKISTSSQNSVRKRQKTLTSDSDSLGENESVPLKKRAIRISNMFSTSSTSESEKSRLESRIRILEKRDYFSTRKDSETSTTSEHHQSRCGFTSPHIENEKALENSIVILDNNKKGKSTKNSLKASKKSKNSKNLLNEKCGILSEKLDKEILMLNTNCDFPNNMSDNVNNTNVKSNETSKSIGKKIKKENVEENRSENSENSKTNPNLILEGDFNQSFTNNIRTVCNSTPINKPKSKQLKDIDSEKSIKRKKKSKNDSSDSDDEPLKTLNSNKKQTQIDDHPVNLSDNSTAMNDKKSDETIDDLKVIKKRGRKPKQAKAETSGQSVLSKKLGSFEKFCSQLCFAKERRKGKTPANNSSLLRKLHPNILLINNRCDIDNLQIKDITTQIVSKDKVICGLCKETVLRKATEWGNHLYSHYGVGWIEGQDSIDVTQYNVVLNFMINFMKVTNCKVFKCRMCDTEFKSALGVLSHILSCGLDNEKKRNETHIMCEHCGKHFHYMALNMHIKCCVALMCTLQSEQMDTQDAEDNNHTEILSNTGRFKRKSTVKAETKLKEIEKDIDITNDASSFIKPIFAVRGGNYRAWKKQIDSGNKVKCCGENCEEIFADLSLLKIHVNSCDKIVRTTYRCLLCKFTNADIIIVKTHIQSKHENILKNYNDIKSDSEVEFSKKDLLESSDEISSGVDENEISFEEEEIEDSDGEYSKKKKVKKQLTNSNIKRVKAYPSISKSKNLLPSDRNLFQQLLPKIEDRSKFFFKNNFTSDILFPSCLPNYIPPGNIRTLDYEPVNQVSMKFSFSKTDEPVNQDPMKCSFSKSDINPFFGSSKSTELRELECFKWTKNKSELLLYIGGPITTLEWVPLPDSVSCKSQFLAISYKCNYNKFTRVINQKSHKTLILIFKLETLENNFNEFFNSNFTSNQCTLEYGIICDNGPVHDMKFLPSGGYDANINRLGLLAVANVDNDVNIYSLPIKTPQNVCDTLNNILNLIQLKPVMRLTLNFGIEDNDEIKQKKDHYFVQCYRITWSKTKGHNILATGYANGCVALWNINTECNLNCFKNNEENETLHFTPLSYFRVGDKFITSLDFHYDHKEPRWLTATSYNRILRIFDIENPSNPTIIVEDQAKSIPTATKWPIIWENLISGTSSDLCLPGPITISPMQLIFARKRCAVIPSGITCIDFNPWNNVCIIGTENGDFTLEIRSEYNLDCTLKRYLHSKIFTYTDLIRLDGNNHPSMEKLTKTNNKDRQEQESKQIEMELSASASENVEPLKFFDKDYKNKYGLIFGPLNFLKDANQIYTSEKRIPTMDLHYYVRINTVACNTNFHGSNFYTLGYENGFVRILYKKLPKL